MQRGNGLLRFPVDGVPAKDRIILFQLEAVGRVATVFHRRIPGRTRSFCAIQDDLVADVF